MNVVVTGATSFIGASVVRELLKQGHQVYAVVRPGSANINKLSVGSDGLHLVFMELENLDKMKEQIAVICPVFFHFGWDGAGSENRKKRNIQQKNVKDSLKALKGAASLGCKRFIFSGSQAEYGINNGKMTEDMECRPISEYGKAKLEFYRQACEFAESECGLEYIHTRIFSIYGPGDHPWSLIESCLRTFRENKAIALGECTQMWNYLYIDDLVNALLSLAFYPGRLSSGNGIFNIAGDSGETKPLRRYVEQMYEVCGKKGTYIYGQRKPNAEGPSNLIPDITKIKNTIRWKPEILFEEGIRKMIQEERCLICKEPLNNTLMFLHDMPASAQDIPDARKMKEDRGITLRLCQCEKCGLVQFASQPVAYYRDVIRSGGFSTTMVELRKKQYSHLIDTYHLEGKKFIEAGCGRGEFLSVLRQFPVEAYGVEHKAELVEIARAQGLQVWQGFAENEDTKLEGLGKPPYDVFLSFNFLEHQPEPDKMLQCLYRNLADDGMGLITVPSLEYILKHDGYYELIRDHLAYYSFDTLRFLLERNGFKVLEEDLINRDTLSVIVRKKIEESWKETDAKYHFNPVDISGLEKSLVEIGMQVSSLIENLNSAGKTIAVWGASHQGFTLASTTKLGGKVKYMIDSAPFKQGRFAPSSHIPIVSPSHFNSEPVDVILIVAPGYTEEIAGLIREEFGTGIKILTLRSSRIEEI